MSMKQPLPRPKKGKSKGEKGFEPVKQDTKNVEPFLSTAFESLVNTILLYPPESKKEIKFATLFLVHAP